MSLAEIVKAHEWDNDIYLASNTPPPLIHKHRAALIQMVKDRDALLQECKKYIEDNAKFESHELICLLKRLEEI